MNFAHAVAAQQIMVPVLIVFVCCWGTASANAEDPNSDPWRLMPVNKIHADEAVSSSMNFGQLKVGAPVPSVEVKTLKGGRPVDLRQVVSGRRTILLFYKNEACMHCSWQMDQLRSVADRLNEMGFQVVAVTHRTWPEPGAVCPLDGGPLPPVLILTDTPKAAGRAFRIYAPDDQQESRYYLENAFGSYGPALYVSNAEGVIEHEWYHRYDHVRLSGRTILAIARHVSAPDSIIPRDLEAALAGPLSVTRLNLSYQNLREVPKGVRRMKNLRDLRLNGNQLRFLPVWIGELTQLRNLEAEDNRLAELPPEIGHLGALENLQLLRNPIRRLPDGIGRLTSLKRLNLMYAPLEDLPPEIGSLEDLQVLRLCKHRLKRLPKEIGRLKSLQHLFMPGEQIAPDHNWGIESLPPAIGELENLIELNLIFNNLTELPPEIGGLKKLELLNVAENDLHALPPEIGDLESLGGRGPAYVKGKKGPRRGLMDKWDLSGNRLSTLPPGIAQIRLKDHAMLVLDRNEFTELPPALGRMPLKALSVRDNRLTELPEELAHWSNVWFMSLNGNRLTELPDWLVREKTLAVLEAARNRIERIPPAIGGLQKLQRLDLSHNRITSVPETLVELNAGVKLEGNPIPDDQKARLRRLWAEEHGDTRRLRF